MKIQRPGVRETVEADMKLMGTLSRFASRRTWRFNEVIDVEAMLKVVFDAMRPELDFVMEARNMTEAAKAAEDFDYVAVPEVIEATGRVLVQGLAPGSPIREADKDRFGAEERRAIGQDLLAFMYRATSSTASSTRIPTREHLRGTRPPGHRDRLGHGRTHRPAHEHQHPADAPQPGDERRSRNGQGLGRHGKRHLVGEHGGVRR